MNLLDLSQKLGIFSCASTFFSRGPCIITTRAHAKYPAEPADLMTTSVFLDKSVLYLRSLAKYAAAFFKISLSSLTALSSCFSLVTSLNWSFLGLPGRP